MNEAFGGSSGRIFHALLIGVISCSSYGGGGAGHSGSDWMARSSAVSASLYRRWASARSALRRVGSAPLDSSAITEY